MTNANANRASYSLTPLFHTNAPPLHRPKHPTARPSPPSHPIAGVLAFGGLAYARTRMDLTPHSQAQIGQALAYPTILAGAVGMSGVGVGVGWFLGAPAGYLTGAYTLVKGSSSIRAWGPPAVAAALVASSSVALLDVLKWDREHSEKWDK